MIIASNIDTSYIAKEGKTVSKLAGLRMRVLVSCSVGRLTGIRIPRLDFGHGYADVQRSSFKLGHSSS